MKELRLLYIEDDEKNREGLVKALSDEILCDFTIKIDAIDTFDNAVEKIVSSHYHIIILDIYKGKPDEGKDAGFDILKQIQKKYFVPVVFYSGSTYKVEELRSQIVGVVSKLDGEEHLKQEIERLVKFNLPFVKENIYNYLEKEFKTYFWDIIHNKKDIFTVDKSDFSLGYLMLRKFGNSLSKEKIYEILEDNTLKKDKIHPMEFYLYPTDTEQEYECGEILQKGNDVFVVLTPSCDLIKDRKRGRKVGLVLVVRTQLLSITNEYKKYNTTKNKENTNNLANLIESRRGDRYFFLPQTPFIESRVIDFQKKTMIGYKKLNKFKRIAKLDSPFAEAMVASFIRYYNRIGFPDIDSDLVIKNLP